jgi:probable DNA repair protein
VNDLSAQVADGTVLITVNQRLARHQLARYQRWQLKQGQTWWETPAILPLRAWLRRLHADALAAGLSSKTLLAPLLQQKAWRQCIDRDPGLALLDIDAAAAAAVSAWELSCAWQCGHAQDDYLSFDQYTWQRWCRRYLHLLEQESWVDEASLAEHLLPNLSSAYDCGLLPGSVILEGFLELPPQLVLFFDALRHAGVSVSMAPVQADAQVHHLAFADDDQEMLSIATQLRCELERDIHQRLGLVVPDLQKRRSAVMRSFDRVFFPTLSPDEIRARGRPYDLSLGSPLSDTSVVMAGLSFLKLCVSSISGSELSAVILSPYLLAAGSEARRREQLDRRLRDDRTSVLTLEQMSQRLYPGSRLDRPLRQLLKRRRLGSATLSDWAARYSDWLKLLGWPGESVDSEEYQAVSAWLECLDDMQLLDDGARVGSAAALQLVKRLARDRIFQLDTPVTPIQIMGRLESHGIAFDCLWVAGLDSEQWPPTGSPDPFLSIARQKAQGVPTASAAARLALARQEFRMWSSQAPLLIASHAQMREGKLLDRAAIPDIDTSDGNRDIACERLARIDSMPSPVEPMSVMQEALALTAMVDDHGPGLALGSEVGGGARLFENQALCPFRAFALHRLGIRELEEAGLGLDPRQHGTLLHRAMEEFWKVVRTHAAMISLEADELGREIERAVKLAIDDQQVAPELQTLERKRLHALLAEWLDQCERPRQAFEVVSLEQRQVVEHGGVVMNVMLDRIDRVADALVVVDYKTGTANQVNTWADRRIVNPQLPLYVLTNEQIQGACFAQVARNQCVFKGVASDDSLLPKVKRTVTKSRAGQATSRPLDNWNDWRAHWREALDVVAGEIRRGLAAVTPVKTACTHCELKSLCRIDEAASSLAEAVDEESVSLDAAARGTDWEAVP